MDWYFMLLESLTCDSIKKNIEKYGTHRLKSLIALAEFEDLKEKRLKSIFKISIRRYKIKDENACWVHDDLFQENLLRNLKFSKEERKLLDKLFKIDIPWSNTPT